MSIIHAHLGYLHFSYLAPNCPPLCSWHPVCPELPFPRPEAFCGLITARNTALDHFEEFCDFLFWGWDIGRRGRKSGVQRKRNVRRKEGRENSLKGGLEKKIKRHLSERGRMPPHSHRRPFAPGCMQWFQVEDCGYFQDTWSEAQVVEALLYNYAHCQLGNNDSNWSHFSLTTTTQGGSCR